MLHRDLKPSIFLVDVSDNLQIYDFGLAFFLKEKPTAALGTIARIIPEIDKGSLKKQASHDEKTDFYSLGVYF